MIECICGNRYNKQELIIHHSVITETVPLHDYNDLVPSYMIEYIDKRRFVHKYHCPSCNNVLIEEKGIIF